MLHIFSFISDALGGTRPPLPDNADASLCICEPHDANKVKQADFSNKDEVEITSFQQIPNRNTDPEQANRYPIREAPLPCASVNYVLKTQAELIQKIKTAVPLNQNDKDRLLFPIIRNVANYVHLLPASSNYHHKGRGGLFRHSLEVGLFAVNMGRMHIFDQRADPEAKYRNKERWFLACFIAGILHDIGKVLVSLTVCGENGSPIWHPASCPLCEWFKDNALERYYLTWKSTAENYNRHETAGAILFAQIVPQATRNFLEEADSSILMNELYDALGGVRRTGALISNLIVKADQLSTSKDLRDQKSASLVSHGVDMPVANVLLDIIVSLVEDGTWKINQYQSGCLPSAVWETTSGTFIIWESAVNEIILRLDERKIQGIPRNPTVLAEKLCESGICRFSDASEAEERFWKISPITVAQADLSANGTREIEEPQDDALPYTYKFFPALRVQMPSRLYEHIAAPSRILTAVLGSPLEEYASIEWESSVRRKVPDSGPVTMISDAAEDVEADRIAQAQKNYEYFDEYGNPVLSILDEDIDEVLSEPSFVEDSSKAIDSAHTQTLSSSEKTENSSNARSLLPSRPSLANSFDRTDAHASQDVPQNCTPSKANSSQATESHSLSIPELLPSQNLLEPSTTNSSVDSKGLQDKALQEKTARANSSCSVCQLKSEKTSPNLENLGTYCAQDFAPSSCRQQKIQEPRDHTPLPCAALEVHETNSSVKAETKDVRSVSASENFLPKSSQFSDREIDELTAGKIQKEKIAPVQFSLKAATRLGLCDANVCLKETEVNKKSAGSIDDCRQEGIKGQQLAEKPSLANSSINCACSVMLAPSKANSSQPSSANSWEKQSTSQLPERPSTANSSTPIIDLKQSSSEHPYKKELDRPLKVADKTFTVGTFCERAAKNLTVQMRAGGGKLAQHVERRGTKLLCPALAMQMFFEKFDIAFDIFAAGCRVGLYGPLQFNSSIQSFELAEADIDLERRNDDAPLRSVRL